MQILKYLLGVVALLFAGFFAMGFFIPKINYSSEVVVNKPINEAWAVYYDESRLGEWITGFQSIELLEGNNNEVGSKYKVKMANDGREMEMIETLTTIEKEKLFAMHFDMDGMNQDVKVGFSAKDENTTIINIDGTVIGKGMFMRSLFACMKGNFKTTTDEMYGKLKNVIETNTKDYFPAPPPTAETTASDAIQ